MSSVFSRLEFKLGVLTNTFNMPVYPCILNSSEKINHVLSESVVLAHTAPPTNTNFWLTFLLARLEEALYEDLSV